MSNEHLETDADPEEHPLVPNNKEPQLQYKHKYNNTQRQQDDTQQTQQLSYRSKDKYTRESDKAYTHTARWRLDCRLCVLLVMLFTVSLLLLIQHLPRGWTLRHVPVSLLVVSDHVEAWVEGRESVSLCVVNQSMVDSVYSDLAKKLLLVDRFYSRVPHHRYTSHDIQLVHVQHPTVTRWRWRATAQCSVWMGCPFQLLFVDLDGKEHESLPWAQRDGIHVQIQNMLYQMLTMWEPWSDVPQYLDILINGRDELKRDAVPADNHSIPRPPIFSAYSAEGVMDVPFVYYDSWRTLFAETEDMVTSALLMREPPLSATAKTNCTVMATESAWDRLNKKNVAFWRGSTTGAIWTPDNYQNLLRYRLVKMSQQSTHHLIDARLTTCTQCEPKQQMEQLLASQLGPWWGAELSGPADLLLARALIDVDGNSWSSRFPQLLASGAIVFKQHTPYKEFWYHLLQPYVHFIPVNSELQDLEQQVSAVLERGEYANVGRNGMVFARIYLTREAVYLYARHVLRMYGQMLAGSLIDQ